MKTVSIGMIGGGFAARLHGNSFRQVGGLELRLRSIADISLEAAKTVAEVYGYEKYTDQYPEVLADDEVDVVILCTPPATHADLVLEALRAGKHVICEKPLTGYFGLPGDPEQVGQVSKRKMYAYVSRKMDELAEAIEASGKCFMYAENYIYTPNIQKAAEFIRAKKSRITFMKGEESVQGSPSAGAGLWKNMGGGTLLRIGCHPLAGIMYLKQVEAESRGTEIRPVSVTAVTGKISPGLTEQERRYLRARPQDVEDFGTMTVTFTDGTMATVFANDNVVGGIQNYIEVYCNDSTHLCKITPTDNLMSYFLDSEGLEDVYLSEMQTHKTGWNPVFVSESVQRGYVTQLQDFMECVVYGRQPISSFALAKETGKLLYAAYISAEERRAIDLDTL